MSLEKSEEKVEKIAPERWAEWSQALQKKLAGRTIRDVVAFKRDVRAPTLKVLREDSTLQEALELLSEEHISGAPVYNDAKECVGILELFDIVACVANEPRGSLLESLKSERSFVEKALSRRAGDSVASCGRYSKAGMLELAVAVAPSTSASEVIARLSMFWRLTTGSTIVSQTDIMAYIYSQGIPDAMLTTPISSTGAMTTEVHSVHADTTMAACMAALVFHQVHVVAVAKRGRLVDEVSVFDLPDLTGLDEHASHRRRRLLSVHHTATLGHVFEVFAANPGRHHIWVTDVTKKLMGVVTRSGLLASLL